ncbi:peptidylprolyl isomerase [Maribacter algicola]|uniref:Peptidylprolyl isomerase n=1 Tax=Meishania litoralis TaxID=3434685 RepID=A0ACC7LNC5_9FLAO
MRKVYLLFTAVALGLSACKSSQRADLGDGLFADIKTNKGEIIVRLEHDKTPITVANFVSLAEGTSPFVSEEHKGKKFYDGLTFHRVMKDFMIQGGDPMGTGMGGPGYKFKSELIDSLRHDKSGILSMANSGGLTTNGSQFFITHKATPWLDGYDENGFLKPCENPRVGCHTVFGEVVEGLAVVDSIANVQVNDQNKPLEAITMETISIIRNGKEAKKFDAIQIMTDYFAEEQAKLDAEEKLKAEFVAELNSDKEKAEELPSGLKILKITEGEGEKPKVGQKVNVFYAGYLPDGTLFDSNYEEVAQKFGKFNEQSKMQGAYEASVMDYSPDSRLVAGFKEALLTMKVGDKFRLFLPPHLGWGAQGAGPIPPNSDTIFDLEIVGIAQ